MKKIITLCFALVLGVAAVNAQTTVKGSKFTDNWSIGVQGGLISPAAHHAVIGDARPIAGLTLTKMITPAFGLAVEGNMAFNVGSHIDIQGVKGACAIDATQVSLLANVNLGNFLCGYKGEPRAVEFVALYGFGWAHNFYPESQSPDVNALTSKAGLNINFNLGAAKAWQINVKPAIVWALSGNTAAVGYKSICHNTHYDLSCALLELTAGVTYKFSNSNGSHNFVKAKLYDQAEVDGLNAKINDLRAGLKTKDADLQKANTTIKDLQNQLNDCRNRAPQVIRETKESTTNNLESVVTFAQGKSVIAASQYPNVERIATYLKNHKDAKVVIKGYASPEGSIEINQKLAKARAEAVKTLLQKKYGIKSSRIQAEGQGVGNMFSEPDWNRVAISTLTE
jgi:outer membrane protein OmpA-like peptidoglycan-associated protein